ncbi:MAG: aminotransferase class I/II-fold pyridoxal phosphate-dependent enzyme [Chloroflexi bacterium]|nr:aminotransferase class I/II-fold pyridoxal phosphate-dependent enzyme [Chloroflexota bacterium]
MKGKYSPFRFSPAGLRGLEPSATLVINEKVNKMWAEGKEVYHMGFGESRFPVHPKIAEALRKNAYQHSYLASQGKADLRERIAEFYERHFQIPAHPERIIIGPGSKALIHALFQSLDGELILPTPSWVSYQPQAHLVNKRVNWVPSSPETGYEFTIDALFETIERSRQAWGSPDILLINSPNNPTGRMFDIEFLEELAQFSRQEGLVVISDEIYGLVTHGLKRHRSISRFYPEGSVALGGLSKHLSLGGWRLGVAILPPNRAGAQLMRALRTIASETWSATTAPVQFAALVAYGEDPDVMGYVKECAHLHAIRTQYFWRKLTEMGVRCPQPEGGFYLFPDFLRWREPLARLGVNTSAELAVYLLEKYQLATLPGSVFGAPAEDLSLRLSTSYLDMETPERAQAVLDAYGQGHDPETLMEVYHPNTQIALARFRHFLEHLETMQEKSGVNGAGRRETLEEPVLAGA